MEFLVIILLFVVVGIAFYYRSPAERKRRDALAALATELGWEFKPSENVTLDEEYMRFEIFRFGESHYAYNTLSGQISIDGRIYNAKMGDFVFYANAGSKSATTSRFSYLILHLPFKNVSNLLIRREGIVDRISQGAGINDIDFESVKFNKRYFIKSPDKKFAYDVIDPRMMEFLMAEKSPTVEIAYSLCCLSDGRRKWSPKKFKATLNWAERFFDNFPDHVTAIMEEEA